MEIRRYREDGTHWGYEVEKTKCYCPACGKQDVYEETGEGDYYQGSGLYCRGCNYWFTMPSCDIIENLVWVDET